MKRVAILALIIIFVGMPVVTQKQNLFVGDIDLITQKKQSKFARMYARLILHAEILGYEVTLGDTFRDDRATFPYEEAPRLHHLKLAGDLNLFKDGVYLSTFDDHLPLGLYWESIGGSWGGRFHDPNHYSLEHEGMK